MKIISQAEIIQASKLEEAVINCKNRFSPDFSPRLKNQYQHIEII